MSLQLARDTYCGVRLPSKRRRSINVTKHNDSLARERGYTPERVARISENMEKPLSEEPYFTLLSSPIEELGEGVDMPIVHGEMDCGE